MQRYFRTYLNSHDGSVKGNNSNNSKGEWASSSHLDGGGVLGHGAES